MAGFKETIQKRDQLLSGRRDPISIYQVPLIGTIFSSYKMGNRFLIFLDTMETGQNENCAMLKIYRGKKINLKKNDIFEKKNKFSKKT